MLFRSVLGLLEDVLIESIDALSHSDLGELSRVVRDGAATPEVLEHGRERSSAAVAVPEREQRVVRAALERLVVVERVAHVLDGSLGRVPAWEGSVAEVGERGCEPTC